MCKNQNQICAADLSFNEIGFHITKEEFKIESSEILTRLFYSFLNQTFFQLLVRYLLTGLASRVCLRS